MQIEKGSLLVGFVLGLAVAAIIMAGAVALSPREAAALPPGTPRATTSAGTGTGPATTASSPTAFPPTPTPTVAPTPRPTPTSAPPALRYETVEVPAGKFDVLEIAAQPGETLELTLQLQNDVDLTLFAPDGAVVAGPLRVRGSYSLRHASASGGNWGVKLDNSFSWFTGKQVLVQYRLLPAS